MPELPEIETIRRGLIQTQGQKIQKILRSDKKMRINSNLDLSALEDKKINSIARRARYLIINFDKNYSLIIHLGMSGRLVIKDSSTYQIQKHDHFISYLDNGKCLVLNDPRRFGFVDLIYSSEIKNYKTLSYLGCEPLSDEFNPDYLLQKLKNKSTNIKTTMMDNKIVVGVGNIYINESLFNSRISPLRSAKSLKKSEIKKLVFAIKKILTKAIEQGGSSINDYVDSAGNLGNFQNNFLVYGRNQAKCSACSDNIIKITQNGRSSFYCQSCQN